MLGIKITHYIIYTILISSIKCKNWSSCILSPFVSLPVTSCHLSDLVALSHEDLAKSRHKQRKAWFFARSLGWEFHWPENRHVATWQQSCSRDTALKRRRIGSVPSPAMALSNLVPVKKTATKQAKRHQATHTEATNKRPSHLLKPKNWVQHQDSRP